MCPTYDWADNNKLLVQLPRPYPGLSYAECELIYLKVHTANFWRSCHLKKQSDEPWRACPAQIFLNLSKIKNLTWKTSCMIFLYLSILVHCSPFGRAVFSSAPPALGNGPLWDSQRRLCSKEKTEKNSDFSCTESNVVLHFELRESQVRSSSRGARCSERDIRVAPPNQSRQYV